MKRLLFSVLYWLCCVAAISLILVSSRYSPGESLFIAAAMLPGALLGRYLVEDLAFDKGKIRFYHSVLLGLAVLVTVYLGICCAHAILFIMGGQEEKFLMNPVFIILTTVAFIMGDMLLSRIWNSKEEAERYIEFTSERRKIKIEREAIRYIASNDDEVWVHAEGGVSYRTKMNISSWEKVLDKRFVRVHRSFIVNRARITEVGSGYVRVGQEKIEVSRKYRDRC